MNSILVFALTKVLPWILLGILIIVFFGVGYFKAPPDVAYIISGFRKDSKIYVGQAGFRLPFFERVDKLALKAVQVDVNTKNYIPTMDFINVKVDATAIVKISQDKELIKIACQNFLNAPSDMINNTVNELLEGNLREIMGSLNLVQMVNNRQDFSAKVQANAVPDLSRLGLELVTFNVQNFSDDNEVITNLGIDNVAQISKNAAIAKSNAEREVEIAKAENAKSANDAKVKAAEEIAKRNNDLAIKQAQLKQEADTKKAQAEAAAGIEAENQRKLKDVAATNANIAKAEREAELKQKQIELKEYELTALVRKQADADKYAAEKKAEAELIARQRDAEAKAYEMEQEAKAKRAQADADRYAAEQQAAGIAAVGEAEALAIEKKAEAQKKMSDASIIEMALNTLPQITANAAAPLTNVDKIIQYGDGNNTKLVKDVMGMTNQVMAGLAENGIDIQSLLTRALNKDKTVE